MSEQISHLTTLQTEVLVQNSFLLKNHGFQFTFYN